MSRENKEKNCKKILKDILPSTDPRIVYAGGGFLIEITDSNHRVIQC